jgi:hypothetical protein
MVYTRRVIACLYDVHGNLPALEAVLADLGEADRYILGGDYTLFGGWPAETLAAKVRSLGDWAEVVALRIERARLEER